MGMSATQARFIELTAKKSDVEYQGQQINQQRTTLSTESSSINTQLLTMSVPTPPSSNDFTKTDYSFQYKSNTCTVSNLTLNPDSSYTINYKYDAKKDTARNEVKNIYNVPKTTTTNVGGIPVTTTKNNYCINGKPLEKVSLAATHTQEEKDAYDTDVSRLKLIYGQSYSGNSSDYNKYESADGETYYVSDAEIAAREATEVAKGNAGISTNPEEPSDLQYHSVEENAATTAAGKWANAQITWSDDGRMTTVTDDDKNTYALSVVTTEDTAAYEDAMNEYTFQKDEYSQVMNAINAKLDIIQSQDKKLELKLKDLDTQQEAINTELDSVKKVIDKNIENSFKAFG